MKSHSIKNKKGTKMENQTVLILDFGGQYKEQK